MTILFTRRDICSASIRGLSPQSHLGFFTWTSGGLFSITNAAQLEAKKSKAKAVQPQKKAASPEERFSKVTEDSIIEPKNSS